MPTQAKSLSQKAQAEKDEQGNSWSSVFATYKPIKLHYLALSTGGATLIFGRIAFEFEAAGFTPTTYLELTSALNNPPLVDHPKNHFHLQNRKAGGHGPTEVIVTAADFADYPALRMSGLTPIQAIEEIWQGKLN